MINLPAILIANGTAILLLLVVLSSLKRPLIHGLLEDKVYYLMVIINILQCLIETIVFFMDGRMIPGYNISLLVLNAILFINTILFAFLWTLYADFKLFEDIRRIKRIYPFVAIPAAGIVICCLVNLWTPVFFSIDQNNIYQRTDLYIIPYAVTYFYLAYGVILVYANRKKVNKYLFLPVLLFMVPILIGSMLQYFFYGYSLVWLGVSIGMISLFTNIQNEASYVDGLSRLYNRQYFNNLTLAHIKGGDAGRVLAGIMLDLDDLKGINDEFGHLMGDDAITEVGKLLHRAVRKRGILFRFGGDEFVILIYINYLKEIMEIIEAVQAEVKLFNETGNKPYKISFSIGYSTFRVKDDTMDKFLKRIDDSMYEEKSRKIRDNIMSDRRHHRAHS